MTKGEILAMKPGEKLDALVTQKVMGHPMPASTPENALELYLAGEPIHLDSWTCVCRYDEGDTPKWIPDPYSTDVSAAWQVLGKVGLAIFRLNNGDWVCCRASYIYHLVVTQDHYADRNLIICREAPEAISKAALIVKMELK